MKRAPLLAVAVWLASEGSAAARTREEGPCTGCIGAFDAPNDAAPPPLLVVLHGDYGQGAPELFRAWEKHAAPRHVALLSIACPKAEGCAGSFWKWNGDPRWLEAQVDAFARVHPVDRDRVWIAGWSGGASYLGYRAEELGRTFAAVVIHGGGMPPASADCAETRPPVYFLVGDRNPLHGLAVGLRAHHTRCNTPTAWHVLPGAEHAAEWSALGTHAPAIFDWLADKKRALPPRAPVLAPVAPAPAPRPIPEGPPKARAPRAGCAIGPSSEDGRRGSLLGVALALAAKRVVRRRGSAAQGATGRSRSSRVMPASSKSFTRVADRR